MAFILERPFVKQGMVPRLPGGSLGTLIGATTAPKGKKRLGGYIGFRRGLTTELSALLGALLGAGLAYPFPPAVGVPIFLTGGLGGGIAGHYLGKHWYGDLWGPNAWYQPHVWKRIKHRLE